MQQNFNLFIYLFFKFSKVVFMKTASPTLLTQVFKQVAHILYAD